MVILGMEGSKIILESIYTFLVPALKKCLTCLQGLAVEHAFFIFPVFEVNEHITTPFALKLKNFPFGGEWLKHVIAGGTEEHA